MTVLGFCSCLMFFPRVILKKKRVKQVCGFQKKNPSNEINLYLVRNVNGKRPQSKSSHIIQTEYTSKDEAFKLKTKKSSYDSTNNNEKKKKLIMIYHGKDLSLHVHGFGISILRPFLCKAKLGRCK